MPGGQDVGPKHWNMLNEGVCEFPGQVMIQSLLFLINRSGEYSVGVGSSYVKTGIIESVFCNN